MERHAYQHSDLGDPGVIRTLGDIRALLQATEPLAADADRGADDDSPERAGPRRVLDRELGDVTAAILTVSRGRASRIVLCNLRRPDAVVEALRGQAAELALELTLVARPDGTGFDVAVRHR